MDFSGEGLPPGPGRDYTAAMRLPLKLACASAISLFFIFSCASSTSTARRPQRDSGFGAPLGAPREFRGLWIASFMNVDWPSRPGLPAAELQAQIDSILDAAKAMNLNALIVQVRPCGDCLYRSRIEPWSSYLSGAQGMEPDSNFDPLRAWIDGARLRGLRLFAWVNPFRAGAPSIKAYAPGSPAIAHPEFARALGDKGYVWLDPGIPEARAYAIDVIKDLAEGYDIDGIFIDDYFYPGREQLGGLPDFPDEGSYAAYRNGGGSLAKDQWRRRNTELFVRDLSLMCRTVRSGMPLGISPAGIWRPGHPAGIRGRDSYAESYADTRAWLGQGFGDVFSPQLYWPIAQAPQSFPLLLGFWLGENSHHRKLWPSLRLGIESVEEDGRAREAISQIMVERGMNPQDSGFLLYGWKQLSDPDSALRKSLAAGPLADPALPPEYPWLPAPPPALSSFTAQRREASVLVEWQASGAREMLLWIEGDGGSREYRILGPSLPDYEFNWPQEADLRLGLRAIGVNGAASPALFLDCQESVGDAE